MGPLYIVPGYYWLTITFALAITCKDMVRLCNVHSAHDHGVLLSYRLVETLVISGSVPLAYLMTALVLATNSSCDSSVFDGSDEGLLFVHLLCVSQHSRY